MAKFHFIHWLAYFLRTYDNFVFEWDSGNSFKSELKHGISIDEIQACFEDNNILTLGIQIEPKFNEDRYGILAKNDKGKVLFVCFTIRAGKIRPISARAANKRERMIYEA